MRSTEVHPRRRWGRFSRLLTGAALAAAVTATTIISAGEAQAAPTASAIVTLANANIGKMACTANSLGGHGYGTSCTGNGGQPEYWCADFAKWVWANAGVTTLDGLTPAARSFYLYGQSHHTLSSTPHAGDAVVFSNAKGDTSSGGDGIHHVAIVTKISGSTIETVSGDWGGESGTEAHFASTSHVVHNTPAYSSAVGSYSSTMDMYIEGYITPVGLVTAPPVYSTELTRLQGSGLVTSSQDADGRMELFASGPDGIYERYQTSATTGAWSAWKVMAGSPGGARLAVGRDTDGRLEMFAVNAQHIYQAWQSEVNGAWHAWQSTGTGGGTDVVVEPNADGRLEAWVAGPNGISDSHMSVPGHAGNWSAWTAWAGPANAHLAAGRDRDGRLELFATNTSTTQLRYQSKPNSSWAAWKTFGAGGTDIAAAADQDGRMELFLAGHDQTWQNYQTEPGKNWHGWQATGGPANAQTDVALNAENRLEQLTVNATTVALRYQSDPNGAWATSTTFTTPPLTTNHILDANIGNTTSRRLQSDVLTTSDVQDRWEQTTAGNWTPWTTIHGPTNP